MSQIDINDVRAAVGALTHATRDWDEQLTALRESQEETQRAMAEHLDVLRDIRESLHDLTAVAARSARLELLVDDAEAIVNGLPDLLRKASGDPTIGMLVGPALEDLAGDLEEALRVHRARRAGPPVIEQRQPEE